MLYRGTINDCVTHVLHATMGGTCSVNEHEKHLELMRHFDTSRARADAMMAPRRERLLSYERRAAEIRAICDAGAPVPEDDVLEFHALLRVARTTRSELRKLHSERLKITHEMHDADFARDWLEMSRLRTAIGSKIHRLGYARQINRINDKGIAEDAHEDVKDVVAETTSSEDPLMQIDSLAEDSRRDAEDTERIQRAVKSMVSAVPPQLALTAPRADMLRAIEERARAIAAMPLPAKLVPPMDAPHAPRRPLPNAPLSAVMRP